MSDHYRIAILKRDLNSSFTIALREYFRSLPSLVFVSADFRKILLETSRLLAENVRLLSTRTEVWPTHLSLEKVSLSANGAAATRSIRSVNDVTFVFCRWTISILSTCSDFTWCPPWDSRISRTVIV